MMRSSTRSSCRRGSRPPARDARGAIFSILEASGAHAHFGGSELQRIYRDVLTGSGHIVFDVDAKGEDYGRALVKSYNRAKEREAASATSSPETERA